MPQNSMPFDAQNTGNHISELLDFKFFWGNMPPDHPRRKGPYVPFIYLVVLDAYYTFSAPL